jgi:hypothetical protein
LGFQILYETGIQFRYFFSLVINLFEKFF